jgi:CPA2 family monovalent cation:H+ antiporter-2
MAQPEQAAMVKDALVFLFAAGVAVPVLKALRLPSVLGFVLAGVALGPFGLGQLASVWPPLSLFTLSDPEAVAPFAELGVLFLLFLLGLELSVPQLWTLRSQVFGTGGLQAGTSAVVIGVVLWLSGVAAPAAATIGLALALSSTAIVMQVLIDERRAAQSVGRLALAVLLFQDLLVAPILIFTGFMGAGSDADVGSAIFDALWKGAAAIGIILLVGRFGLRGVFRLAARAGGRDFLMALTLLTMVGASVLTAIAGLSLALGAFLAGLMLGETEFKHQTEVDLEPFKGLLLGLFFMSVGMSLNLPLIAGEAVLIAGALVAMLLIKLLLAYGAARLTGADGSTALHAGLLLAPAGEFAFVVLASAIALSVVDARMAGLVTAVAGLSMMLIPFAGHLAGAISRRVRTPEPETVALPDPEAEGLSGHVVLAGFGRVGQAVAHVLQSQRTPFVAIDRDPARVARERAAGWPVYLGDASRAEILTAAGAESAALFIVTVDDAASAEAMVRSARALRPDAPVLARARDTEHAAVLMAQGASHVIPEAIEAALQLASRALTAYGYPEETVQSLIRATRDGEYALGVAAPGLQRGGTIALDPGGETR